MEYNVKDLGRKTWVIDEYTAVQMFLIEGDEKAMLIDTGAGIGDLKAQVEKLTDKPLIVVNTHGHVDHTGGNMQFDEVWLDPEDFELDKKMNTFEVRVTYAASRVGTFWPEKKEEAMAAVLPQGEINYRELKEGMVFDLGNRKLEVIKIPGHSMGSIALLDKDYNQMFTGDMVNFQVLLYAGMGAPREVYIESLRKIMARSNEYDRILRGHSKPDGTVEDMKTLIGLVQGIIDGSDLGHYEEVGIRKGWVVRNGEFSVWYEGPNGESALKI
ncbi:MAG: MBL fold metallo-hydrolase [Clostridia bacterium]|nr:MBL fold metallo-hydrolase [Clostridia bacterium]